MENKAYKIIDNLSQNDKAKICDNCPINNECKNAYDNFFKRKLCYEIFLEIKEELNILDLRK